MFCSQCGTDHSDDSRFCRKCGQPLGTGTASSNGSVITGPGTRPPASSTFKVWRTIALSLLFLLLLGASVRYFMRMSLGDRGTSQLVAAVVHNSVVVKDEIENLPAASWKAVGLTLPYSGTVTVNLSVVEGNPIDGDVKLLV